MKESIAYAQYEHKPNGYILIDGQEAGHTIRCVHCSRQFLSVRGSGKQRGYCMRCKGIECGRKECFECIPFEAKLEYYEKQHKLTKMKREFSIEQQIKKIEKQYGTSLTIL